MYDLPHFKAASAEEVMAFMQAHPFITLCGSNAQGQPVATHIPVLIENREGTTCLHGHLMRDQDHTVAFEQNAQVLAIFTGAHTYVSASWYTTPRIASTWNYQAVHAQGILRFTTEEDLYQLLEKLTLHYEGDQSPALVEHMKPGYVQSLMKYIVAFEIEITSLQHVFKLSQNRDAKSYHNIIQQLAQQPDADGKIIAGEMEKRSQP